MAYKLPTFNLECDVYTGPWLTKTLRIAAQECAIAVGVRQQGSGEGYGAFEGVNTAATRLLLPAGVDLRDAAQYAAPYDGHWYSDFVEFPIGSGAFWIVNGVYDVARGWSNEYRVALLGKAAEYLTGPTGDFSGVVWPSPMP